MKNCIGYILLLVALLLIGCNSTIKEDEFVGVWVNEEEECKIELNKDFTFKSINVPFDVVNTNHPTFNKQSKVWEGVWSLDDEQLKLMENDNYYYLYVNTTLPYGKPRLSVRLLNESGGQMIYFDKK